MWRGFRRWLGWTPWKALIALRTGGLPRVKEVRFRYQLAGIGVPDEPIPWSAELVQVEARVELDGVPAWRPAEFSLLLPDRLPLAAAAAEEERPGTFRFTFTFPPPGRPTRARLCRRGRFLAELDLPFLSAEEFLRNIRLEEATVLARLSRGLVPCQAVVSSQLQRLVVCGLLASPSSLLPLLDLGVTVEFADAGPGQGRKVSLALPRSQLIGRRSFLSAAPPEAPGPGGTLSVRWIVAGRCLAESTVRTISLDDFRQSLYLVDARYACQEADGPPVFRPYLPARGRVQHVGPCFRLASREPGAVGYCTLGLRTLYQDPARPPEVRWHEILVTDGPSPFMPLLVSSGEFEQVAAFELLRGGQVLGSLSGCRPVVRFTSEGGFTELTDFDWTPVDEEELEDRLKRLMAGQGPGMLPGTSPIL
jgi:hypothetical protein